MKKSSVPVQDHFPSLHSETIYPLVLSVLLFGISMYVCSIMIAVFNGTRTEYSQ